MYNLIFYNYQLYLKICFQEFHIFKKIKLKFKYIFKGNSILLNTLIIVFVIILFFFQIVGNVTEVSCSLGLSLDVFVCVQGKYKLFNIGKCSLAKDSCCAYFTNLWISFEFINFRNTKTKSNNKDVQHYWATWLYSVIML